MSNQPMVLPLLLSEGNLSAGRLSINHKREIKLNKNLRTYVRKQKNIKLKFIPLKTENPP